MWGKFSWLRGMPRPRSKHYRQVSQSTVHMWLQLKDLVGFRCLPSRLPPGEQNLPSLFERQSWEWGALQGCSRELDNVNTLDYAQPAPPFWPSSTFTTCFQSSELTCPRVASFGSQLTVCIEFSCLEPELFLLMNNVNMESLAFISVSPELALVTST